MLRDPIPIGTQDNGVPPEALDETRDEGVGDGGTLPSPRVSKIMESITKIELTDHASRKRGERWKLPTRVVEHLEAGMNEPMPTMAPHRRPGAWHLRVVIYSPRPHPSREGEEIRAIDVWRMG